MSSKLLKAYFLKNIDLTPSELDSITYYYQEKNVAKGEFILRRGQICNFEGYVVAGCFKVYVIDEKGDEKILYFAARDWWVMEIDSFANQTPSEIYIQAIMDSVVLVISKRDKEQLFLEMPKVERLFRIMSQKAVAAWQKRLIRNHTMNAEERYKHFVTTYPEIADLVTNKLIASYLGITQEFLSMIRKRRAEKKIPKT
ncbi:MAG: Crp/Fnr family transcriptional regulator [Bacteroidota bacterium]